MHGVFYDCLYQEEHGNQTNLWGLLRCKGQIEQERERERVLIVVTLGVHGWVAQTGDEDTAFSWRQC